VVTCTAVKCCHYDPAVAQGALLRHRPLSVQAIMILDTYYSDTCRCRTLSWPFQPQPLSLVYFVLSGRLIFIVPLPTDV
jgi:hypothetical protein